MDQTFEIELLDEATDEAAGVQLPMNFLAFGEIENDDVKVYIKQDVYKALEKLSASDTSKELGSILIGDYSQDLGKMNVVISNYVEAKYTDASAATLTFTHETWDYVHKEHERLYPDKKIIGWQHTHPNYGIFLSNYDMFIQENFFNLPFQIAYVIDPIQNIRGFFQWKNGKIEKLKGYYIYDDVGKPIKIEQTKVKKADGTSAKKSKVPTILAGLFFVGLVLLSIFAINLKKNNQLQNAALNELKDKLATQEAVILTQEDTITKLQDQLANIVLDDSRQTSAAKLISMLENHEITLPNQEDVLSRLKSLVDSAQAKNKDVHFAAYTVVAGDNLYNICAANDIDYHANIQIILALNGITDANHIYMGQTILLPITD